MEQLERLVAVTANLNCDSETIYWLSCIFYTEGSLQAVDTLLLHLSNNSARTRRGIVEALGDIGDLRATDALLAKLQDVQEAQEVRNAAAVALGQIGGTRGIAGLLACLQDTDEDMRRMAVEGVAHSCADETDRRLLSKDLDGVGPWLDPLSPITSDRIAKVAGKLKKSPEEIQDHYTVLAERFGLKFA